MGAIEMGILVKVGIAFLVLLTVAAVLVVAWILSEAAKVKRQFDEGR